MADTDQPEVTYDVDPDRWFLTVKEVLDDGRVELAFLTIDGSGDRRKIIIDKTQNIRIPVLIEDAEPY